MKSKLIILGCGSSMGVPRIDGYWGKCNPKDNMSRRDIHVESIGVTIL